MPSSTGTTPISSRRFLQNPFPKPEVFIVTITNSKKCPGIVCKSESSFGPTSITDISKDSPFHGTSLRVGQHLLSINGVCVQYGEDGMQLIKQVWKSPTLTLVTCDLTKDPVYKITVSPNWKHHPGVAFAPTRGHCLVQVSRIFSLGPLVESGLQRDDIVLAVNGQCVSSPNEATHALKLSQHVPFTSLYSVDMQELRENLLRSTIQQSAIDIKLTPQAEYITSGGTEQILGRDKFNMHVAGLWTAVLEYNTESQHLQVDPLSFHCIKAAEFSKGDWTARENRILTTYTAYVLPFLKQFNQTMEQHMSLLEEAVCCEAWNHQKSTTTSSFVPTKGDAAVSPKSVVPMAQAIPIADAQRVKSSSSGPILV